MLNSSLAELKQGIQSLSDYIGFNQKMNQFLAKAKTDAFLSKDVILTEVFKNTSDIRRKKVFEYNSYVVTLYGLLERFLEDVVDEYLVQLIKILPSYRDLPQVLKDAHFKLTSEVQINLENPKFKAINRGDLVDNLAQCEKNNLSRINIIAFQHHPYNFKHPVVIEYVKRLGIATFSQDIKRYEPLKGYFETQYGNVANLDAETLFNTLDDLSQRRNDVSHGVVVIDILSPLLVKEYVAFVQLYAETVNNILKNELVKSKFNVSNASLPKIKIINHRILCCNVVDTELNLTGNVIIKKGDHSKPEYIASEILQIQINNQPYQNVAIKQTTAVGLELSQRISEADEFKLWPYA